MRIKILACKIMARELSLVSGTSPHYLDITTIRQEYHNTPLVLRQLLQEEIDRIENGQDPHSSFRDYDAIVLGYGLCSNSVTGLHSRRIPLVIPRMHDCISLFLGSSKRYLEAFQKYRGTFFYSHAWAELVPDQGAGMLERKRAEYMEKYDGDEDMVEDLMEAEEMLLANYHGMAYIDWEEIQDPSMKELIRNKAMDNQWEFYELQGSSQLLRKMISGDWNTDEFLIVEPGQKIAADGSENILSAE